MSSEDAIFEALSHETRRRIIRMLREKPLAYSEMLEALGVETGALNYHLGKLKVWLRSLRTGLIGSLL